MSEVLPVISDEAPATQPKAPLLKWTVSVIAVVMSLYHMYVAGFGPPQEMIFRGTHLLFALTLVFLLYPLKPHGAGAWRALDALMLIASWAFLRRVPGRAIKRRPAGRRQDIASVRRIGATQRRAGRAGCGMGVS